MACSHLRVLLVLQVLVDGRVEVLGVALVDAVDLPLRLDLHVLLGQDELADGLKVGNVYRDLKKKMNLILSPKTLRQVSFFNLQSASCWLDSSNRETAQSPDVRLDHHNGSIYM